MTFDEFCSRYKVTASERRKLADYLTHIRTLALRGLLQFSDELEVI